MENKIVLTFTEKEIDQLKIIIIDEDKDAALDYLKQCLEKKIKAVKTGCNPDIFLYKNK